MDEDAGSMERIFNSGAGAIVTKSIGLKPREGYPNPTVIELEHGILNAMGLPNPGIEEFGEEIRKLKKLNIPVIGSIFGSNSKEFVENFISQLSGFSLAFNITFTSLFPLFFTLNVIEVVLPASTVFCISVELTSIS